MGCQFSKNINVAITPFLGRSGTCNQHWQLQDLPFSCPSHLEAPLKTSRKELKGKMASYLPTLHLPDQLLPFQTISDSTWTWPREGHPYYQLQPFWATIMWPTKNTHNWAGLVSPPTENQSGGPFQYQELKQLQLQVSVVQPDLSWVKVFLSHNFAATSECPCVIKLSEYFLPCPHYFHY